MSTETERDLRGISRCWQNNGWHYAGAGPCFDTYEQVSKYRDEYDKAYEAQRKWRENPWNHGDCLELWTFNRIWRS